MTTYTTLSNIGEKILSFLTLLNDKDDRNKDGCKLDLSKYSSLTTEDIEGHWKNWSFTLEKYFIEYFGKENFKGLGYENTNTLFYERTLMCIVGCIYGDLDFCDDKYQADLTETIEYIKMSCNTGEKIIDYLKLLTNNDDKYKDSDELDLDKYPALNIDDVEGSYKYWIFNLEPLYNKFFEKEGFIITTYDKVPFYERTMMYLNGTVFGTPNYPYEKHLEDVKETIEYIQTSGLNNK